MERRWIGSAEHKRLVCDEFVHSHIAFEPEDIRWPDLDDEGLRRLQALPIWNEAVRTEAYTALEVQTLGRAEPDPMLARAIALQGYEEGRHATILKLLTEHYGIPVEPFDPPQPPNDPVWAFMSTGYAECLDSFFAFGLFALGKRSGYFPAELIDIFEPIMQEEARHILFIVNWAAYLRSRTALPLRPVFDARRTWTIARQLIGHARMATRMGGGQSQQGFTMNHGAFGELSARAFLELCLAENARRLAPYDSRLLRPMLVPASARFALKFLSEDSARAGAAPAKTPRAPAPSP